jgi:hypothetical protein
VAGVPHVWHVREIYAGCWPDQPPAVASAPATATTDSATQPR